MKINLNIILTAAILFTTGCLTGCMTNQASDISHVKPSPTQPSGTATPADTTNTVPGDSSKPETREPVASDSPVKILLDTPTNAYKTAYAARQKKDLEALKRVMSTDALEFFTIISEPGESIDQALLQMAETPQAPTNESRNEKIKGNTATLEYPNAKGEWRTMDFVKEDGEWKLTFPKGNSSSKPTK